MRTRPARPRPARGMPPVLALVVGLALALALAGCVRMPSQGPVVEMPPGEQDGPAAGTYYDPRPPSPDATREEVVSGFLEAMKATPIRTSVAAQYLSEQAQDSWSPQSGIITYSGVGPVESGSDLTVELSDAQLYDDRGAWVRRLGPQASTLRLPVVMESGEWRIDGAPDALVVPASWFADRYQRVSLYFFDPTGRVLVPEPVQVPLGDQTATALVRGLLAGPRDGLGGVLRSYLPQGADLALSSVPISDAGVAEVSLKGGTRPGAVGPVTEQMVAQLAWTLRQEPRVRAIRVVVDGQVLTAPDGSQEMPLDSGAAYDPTGAQASSDLFALQEGLLVRGPFGDPQPTGGQFGIRDLGLSSLGVDPTGTEVAGVTGDASAVLRTSVENPDEPVVELVSGATDVLPPAWDLGDRLWLVDRPSGGARVLLATGDQVRSITVPGVSGSRVLAMRVSRDGSRLVTVVRRPGGDRLLVSRVRHDERGRVLGVGRPDRVRVGSDSPRRIVDVGWRSATALVVLSRLESDLLEASVHSVDGAPGTPEVGPIRLRGRRGQVVGSPVTGEPVLVRVGGRVTDLDDPVPSVPGPPGVDWMGYAG